MKSKDKQIIKKFINLLEADLRASSYDIASGLESDKKKGDETTGVIAGEKFTIGGVAFQSMPFQGAGERAASMARELAGRKDTGSDEDKQAVIDIVYKTANVPGYNTPEKLENLKGRLGTKSESYWSSWFYTAAYKPDTTYPNRNSMSYPARAGYKNRKRIFASPDSYKGKELYVMFKPDEAPIFPGDGIFKWRAEAKGRSFNDLDGPRGPAHMRILGTDGKFYGGNESGTAKGTAMSMDGRMFKPQKGYLGVFKRVKVLGQGVSIDGSPVTQTENVDLVDENELRELIRKNLISKISEANLRASTYDIDSGLEPEKSSGSGGGPVDVKDPVNIKGGGYPEKNIRYVEAAMTEKGITNKFVRVGILCTIAKESNFKPKSEKTYHATKYSAIIKIWPKLAKFGKEKIDQMKKSTSPSDGHKKAGLGFFDYLYGGRYGNGPEKTGDGSRYRGRGFNQVTFKGSYKKYGRLAGIDLVNNPDQLNNPEVAAKVAVAFLANRLKSHYGSVNPDAKSYEEGIKMAATANCKSKRGKKNCSRAIRSATKRLPHFKYDDDGSSNIT